MSTENTLMTDAPTNTDGAASTTATETTATDTTSAAATDAGTQQQASDAQQTQDAAKTAEGDGEQGKSADDATKSQVPEKYEFNMPEGVQMDEAGVEAFSAFAKEAGLSQEAAQGLISKLAPAMQARQAEAVEATKAQWVESAKADKEFGGDKLSENLAVAKKALDAFGSPELREFLNTSGLGNNPEIIRAFYRAGKAISEDRFVPSGGSGAAGTKDPAKSLYPNQ